MSTSFTAFRAGNAKKRQIRNMPSQEKDRVSGSLTWWKIAQITLYNQLSLILIMIGILCMVYAFAWMAMQPIKIADWVSNESFLGMFNIGSHRKRILLNGALNV